MDQIQRPWHDHEFTVFDNALNTGTFQLTVGTLFMFLRKLPCKHYGLYVRTEYGFTTTHLEAHELKALPFDWTRFTYIRFDDGDIIGVMQLV